VAIAMLQMREESERRDTSQEKERERAFQRQRKCEDRRREVLQANSEAIINSEHSVKVLAYAYLVDY